jgi:hypothetical protein
VKDFWSLWYRIAIAEGKIKPDTMKVGLRRAFLSVHIMGRLLVKGRVGPAPGEIFVTFWRYFYLQVRMYILCRLVLETSY